MVADQKKTVGGHVKALARHIQADAECRRRYGLNWGTRFLNGTVIEIAQPRPRCTMIIAFYDLENGTTKIATLNLRSVKGGWIAAENTNVNPDTTATANPETTATATANVGANAVANPDTNTNANVNANANLDTNTNTSQHQPTPTPTQMPL